MLSVTRVEGFEFPPRASNRSAPDVRSAPDSSNGLRPDIGVDIDCIQASSVSSFGWVVDGYPIPELLVPFRAFF